MSVIVTRNLTKRYGARRGVEGVNLEVGAGSIFGFLGPNGAGKSTTIRMLLGFFEPTSGSAEVLGRDCWRESHRVKRDVGYLPGDLRLYNWMTGNIALRIIGRIHGADLTRRGGEIAERFRLDMSLRVDRMSRGTRQKLGLLLALAHEPRLAVLDEPTSGLDPLIQDELANELREFAGRGNTVFFSSHTLSEVEQLCDRIAIVRDGLIVADEALTDLRARARRTVVLQFASVEAAAAATPPSDLELLDRSGRQWRGQLVAADGRDFAKWLAAQAIDDFSVSTPNLEGVFRQFYHEAPVDSAAAARPDPSIDESSQSASGDPSQSASGESSQSASGDSSGGGGAA